MSAGVGVTRSGRSIGDAAVVLLDLERATPAAAWRTRNQLRVATEIARAARVRRESRGGHRRTDYPPRFPFRPEPLAR